MSYFNRFNCPIKPTKKEKPTVRQESNPSCDQGTTLNFVPSDGKTETIFKRTIQNVCPIHKRLDKTLLANPERGYYRHHEIKFSPHKPISENEIKTWTKEGLTLALMIFNLEPFVKKDFSKSDLDKMTSDFNKLRKGGMKAIVRFSYNQTSLKKPEKHNFPKTTDAEKPQLLKHINQLERIFQVCCEMLIEVLNFPSK